MRLTVVESDFTGAPATDTVLDRTVITVPPGRESQESSTAANRAVSSFAVSVEEKAGDASAPFTARSAPAARAAESTLTSRQVYTGLGYRHACLPWRYRASARRCGLRGRWCGS